MMRPAVPHRTACHPLVVPTPTMAPVIVCVVDTGMPSFANAIMVTPPPVSAQKPPIGASFVRLWPIVRTIRHPPKNVPSAIAVWHEMIIHQSMWNGRSFQMVPKSTTAMMPITFCASFVPWLKEKMADDTSCSRRNHASTLSGVCLRTVQMLPSIIAVPNTRPIIGESTMKAAIFAIPEPTSPWNPSTGTVAPIMPPASAWDDEDGNPHHHVSRFHTMAPISAEKMTISTAEGPAARNISKSMMPLPTVLATCTPPPKAAMKLKNAAQATARFGDSTRVDTTVAMEFAASWKPLMKSKTSATATMKMTAESSISGMLQDHAFDDVGDAVALVRGRLDQVVDFLPLDDRQRVHAALEEPAHARAQRLVRLGLQPLDVLAPREDLVRLLDEPQRRHHLLDLLGGQHQEPRQFSRVGLGGFDLVVMQPRRRRVGEVQHVIDARQQRVNLRPVERGDELLVQPVEGRVRHVIAPVLDLPERLDADGHVPVVHQQGVQHLRPLHRHGTLRVEGVEELIGLGHQPLEHRVS
ncbi:hypothetical protein STIAU_8438 [Stigmatella aurantiaca DW4/3-1]|uniref:Uncharacterized protein n=1 Tax=Stigmatella aurantiaca (strain DW4/3-1) TaxID=378806 RepID=Q08QU6_STIAD|nr:hypothetical protein STIAU_8438 [Stigmatella aurantiaca DW4/3-1]